MGHRDWEGPRRQKPPKEASDRPPGRVVGMSVALFLVLPAVVVLSLAAYLVHGYTS